jgi:hypothetical protein
MPRPSPYVIVLSEDERDTLLTVSRKYTAPYKDVVRAKLVLLAAEGWQNDHIAEHLDLPVQIVTKWRRRFFHQRLAGLRDHPRRPPAAGRRVRGRA